VKHVLVAGSLHYDLVVHADRFPIADEYVDGHAPRRIPGGKGGNQAVACARCGTPTLFAGRVGDDETGDLLKGHLVEAGVDVSRLQTGAGEASGSSIAIVNPFGDFGAMVLPGANLAFDAGIVDMPAQASHLLLQNEIPEAANLVLAERAKAAGLEIVLNGCPSRAIPDALLALTGTLILGVREAEALVGGPFSGGPGAFESIVPIAERVPQVIVFLGGGGMVHIARGGRPEYHPAREKRPQSMHGALDFFVGAYVSQLAGGSEFEAAAHYAQAAATLFIATPVERRDFIRATQIRARLGEDDR
jgi:ribokinase